MPETPKKAAAKKAPTRKTAATTSPSTFAAKKTPAGQAPAKKSPAKKIAAKAVASTPPTHEQISRRAYEIFQLRGHSHGNHHHDWAQAEHELRQD